MLQFTITPGTKPNAIEISFNEMPSEAVRTAIKSLKMRWNKAKHVWWGFVTEEAATQAITGAEAEAEQTAQKTIEEIQSEYYTDVTEGYMGANALVGSKSNISLYGSALSKAIREDLKKAGIKCTARCSTYSGGQHLTVTLEVTKADFVSEEEYIKAYDLYERFHCTDWIYLPHTKENISRDALLYSGNDIYTDEQREEIRIILAKDEYSKYWNSGEKNSWGGTNNAEIMPYRWEHKEYMMFTEKAFKRMELAERIVRAYRYDDSNSMVDYFDTNFYYDLVVKNVDREEEKP